MVPSCIFQKIQSSSQYIFRKYQGNPQGLNSRYGLGRHVTDWVDPVVIGTSYLVSKQVFGFVSRKKNIRQQKSNICCLNRQKTLFLAFSRHFKPKNAARYGLGRSRGDRGPIFGFQKGFWICFTKKYWSTKKTTFVAQIGQNRVFEAP